jgi:hypothetical protein
LASACQREAAQLGPRRATIVSSYSRIRSPWNGGSSSLRWRMCSGPVSTTTELGPITGATGESAAPDGATSAGAVITSLTA